MSTRIFFGQRRVDAIDPCDRGLAYGDGVFETILVHVGKPVWWDGHLSRLRSGCEVLGIDCPDPIFLRHEVDALVGDSRRGVLKLVVTRGVGERGYALPTTAIPTVLMTLSTAPPAPPNDGLNLRWCETPLSIQPRLAGIKHLNRLEQVVARAEWDGANPQEPAIHEGLMCDTSGRVVCATSANLFAFRDGRWITPPVIDSGIAGVCRRWILDHVAGAAERELTRVEVESADSLVLCNAVRGILPVVALGSRRWFARPDASALRQQLLAAEPAFETTEDV